MKLTKYGHAAYLIEDASTKILIDPGSFSTGFDAIENLTAVLYTHNHGDHYDEAKLRQILSHNSSVQLIADEDTASAITQSGSEVTVAHEGDKLSVGDLSVEVIGHDHAQISRFMPVGKNVGYLVAGKVFYPGDALTLPGRPIEVLLLPVEGPWTKVGEVIDYLVKVSPKLALPSHEAVSAVPEMQYGMIGGVATEHKIEWRPLGSGEAIEVA